MLDSQSQSKISNLSHHQIFPCESILSMNYFFGKNFVESPKKYENSSWSLCYCISFIPFKPRCIIFVINRGQLFLHVDVRHMKKSQ